MQIRGLQDLHVRELGLLQELADGPRHGGGREDDLQVAVVVEDDRVQELHDVPRETLRQHCVHLVNDDLLHLRRGMGVLGWFWNCLGIVLEFFGIFWNSFEIFGGNFFWIFFELFLAFFFGIYFGIVLGNFFGIFGGIFLGIFFGIFFGIF